MAHSQYEGSVIKGNKLKDLSFTVDDLKLFSSLTVSLLVIDCCVVFLEPSKSQYDYTIVLTNELIQAVKDAND
jgi:hypothetical protein